MRLPKRTPTLVVLGALAAAAAAFPAAHLLAGEPEPETAAEKIERLFSDLGSERDEVRERAEKELFALGDEGRRELERISRDADPKRAITALRLLGRDGWSRTKAGEETARPATGTRPGVPPSAADWEDDLERRLADMRRRLEEMQKRFREDFSDWRADWPHALEFGIEDGAPAGGTSSGRVIVNDRSLSWTIDEKGRVKVTTKDGRDAAETTVEAESMDALRKEHPDVAKRLEEVSPQGGMRRWTLRLPREAPQGNVRTPTEDEWERAARKLDAAPAAKPALGIEWQPVPELLREHLGLGDGGVVVERVLPGTLAERLGLRRHDLLVEVAGRKVSNDADVRAAVESVKPGDEIAASVVRKGERQTLSAKR